MRVTYDPSVDAAYIYLRGDSEASSHGYTYPCDPLEVHGMINLDFDENDVLVGLEVLDASKRLSAAILALAEQPE